jgi:NagD protein
MDFSKFAAVLLDLDGTLYHEEDALPGAARLVSHLQSQGKLFACLSNSTSIPAELTIRLARMGMNVSPDRIWTAAAAAAEYVVEHFPAGAERSRKPRVFNLASEGIQAVLEGRVDWVNAVDEPCDAVIAGAIVNTYATEDRRFIALNLLRHGARLIGICADRVYPSPRGIEFGSGAFNAMLGYAANVTPFFCGKPEPIFFTELCDRLRVRPDQCLLIGDNLEADIAGGKAMGMTTVLTLTGVTRRADVDRLTEHQKPDQVIESLNDLL